LKEDFVNSIRSLYRLLLLASLTLLVFPPRSWAVDPPQERAAAALEQDLKTDPNNAELWLHLGFAYRKMEMMDQARQAFEKVAALNPHETDAYYMLGLIYESQHNKAAAQKAWKDYLAAEANPDKRAVAEKHIHHLSQ
jgi:cytochrome c-type biogenesis protein CcmH/NrfG